MKSSWGGKREGAGRPTKEQVAMTILVPPEIAEEARRRAKEQKKSIGSVFAEAIKEGCRD